MARSHPLSDSVSKLSFAHVPQRCFRKKPHHPSDSLYGNATAWGLIAAKHDHGAQRALFLSLELFTLCSILSLECFARSAVAENVALRDENEIAVAHAKADLIRALSSVL